MSAVAVLPIDEQSRCCDRNGAASNHFVVRLNSVVQECALLREWKHRRIVRGTTLPEFLQEAVADRVGFVLAPGEHDIDVTTPVAQRAENDAV